MGLFSSLSALVFCPEYDLDISSQTAHVLTVIAGGLVVFVPMAYLLPVLVPRQSGGQRRYSSIRVASEVRC
jgi:hypothetical protein